MCSPTARRDQLAVVHTKDEEWQETSWGNEAGVTSVTKCAGLKQKQNNKKEINLEGFEERFAELKSAKFKKS